MAYDPLLSHTLAQLGVGLSHAGEAIANAITAKGEYQTRGLEAQLAANLQKEAMGLQKYLADLDYKVKNKEIDTRKAAYDAYVQMRKKYADEAIKLLNAMNSGDSAQATLSSSIMELMKNMMQKIENASDPKAAWDRIRAAAIYETSKKGSLQKQMAKPQVQEEATGLVEEIPQMASTGTVGLLGPFHALKSAAIGAINKLRGPTRNQQIAAINEAVQTAAGAVPGTESTVYDIATPELAQQFGLGSMLFARPQANIQAEMMALPILMQLAQIAGRSNAAGEAARYGILGGMLNPGPFTY